MRNHMSKFVTLMSIMVVIAAIGAGFFDDV